MYSTELQLFPKYNRVFLEIHINQNYLLQRFQFLVGKDKSSKNEAVNFFFLTAEQNIGM